MSELTTEVMLGNDSECETCGRTNNELVYTFDLTTGEHTIEAREGCFGGAIFTDRSGERAAWVLRAYAETYPSAEAELRELAEGVERCLS